MKAYSEFSTTDTRPPSENILRGLFAFFLNTESLDPMLIELDGTFEDRGAINVGSSVLHSTYKGVQTQKVILLRFVQWLDTAPLAKFMIESPHVMSAFQRAIKGGEVNPEPFCSLIAQRFKDLTDYERKRMPKDIKKSFETKSRNAILKFIKEWEASPNQTRYVRAHHEKDGRPVPLSMGDWFEFALDLGHNEYLPYPALRIIHNLLAKCERIGEDLTESIEVLKKEFQVAQVMLS